jgi:hypothetical protein
LKKWKGVALSPDNERRVKDPPPPPKAREIDPVQKENVEPDYDNGETSTEPTVRLLNYKIFFYHHHHQPINAPKTGAQASMTYGLYIRGMDDNHKLNGLKR